MIAAYGMDPATGRAITGLDHIRACCQRILTTPIGSCIERRDFGSLLPDLVDAPLNDTTRLQAVAASAAAILKWEPRLALTSLEITQEAADPSKLWIDMEATVIESGTEVSLQYPISLGGSGA